MAGIFRTKVYDPVLLLLKRGASPERLAWSVALGVVFGIMPAIGIVTVLSTFVALRLRLNVPLLLGVSYLLSPLYLLLYIPFIKAGLFFFEDDFALSLEEIQALFRADWRLAIREIWFANLMGLVVWAAVAVPVAGLVYTVSLPLIRKVALRMGFSTK